MSEWIKCMCKCDGTRCINDCTFYITYCEKCLPDQFTVEEAKELSQEVTEEE